MKKKVICLMLGLTMIGAISTAQVRRCGSMENLERLKLEDPALESRMVQIENATQQFINTPQRGMNAIVNIPVVVHVVYNTASQNISDAQIQSQLAVLNEDFRRLNADRANTPAAFAATAADPEITFCLATKDPNGAATTGIIRKSTTVTSFSDNDGVKYSSSGGDNAWPAGSYLNIWVCNLGGGLLGYAQFPGGPAATDGVVMLYSAFGRGYSTLAPYNKGRTATHEVGHWLNLRHIWGDASCGSDLVSDTPTQQTSNYSCPAYPHKTCGNTSSGDEFMNYMDYTDDACMNMFSQGQKSRMQALFAAGGSRYSLTTSTACGGTITPATCNVPAGLSTSSLTASSVTLNWTSTGASSYNVKIKPVSSTTWTTATSTTNSKAFTGLTASTAYQFQVQSVCSGGTSAYSALGNFTTPSASTTTSGSITVGTGTSTMIAPYGTYYMDEKSQFIVTKAELAAAGYTSSNNSIRAMAFNVASASSQVMNGFTIKMRHTTAASYSSASYLSNTSMTTVFSANKTATTGWNTHTFTTPFVYNGVDNLLIEICWDNSSYTTDTKVYCSVLSTNNTILKQQDVAAGGICTATTGTLSTSRPNIRFTMGASAARTEQEEISAAPQTFNLFPNPVTSGLTLQYSTEADESQIAVSVYNMMGALIKREESGSVASGDHEYKMDLGGYENMPNGIYMLTLTIDGKPMTKRFVLAR
ncbi:MAG: hypothetical protein K0Q95_451 [Bacteroidota bacterium]|jgi:hypothetical protein|nr:hypothetical protein [Bacteroidota bacterium]